MKRKRYMLFIALMMSALFAFNGSLALAKDMTADDFKEEAEKNITTISFEDAKALFDKGGVPFLDVRGEKEYRSGHIPGAINIPRGLLEFVVGDKLPDKDATIVVYCKTGGRSCLASYTLVEMGYKNIKNMDGGWKAWVAAGYPVE
ncbi:MAG: rhodanese-like domain-containing protein [Thermodesulfobacteriota bacterium]